MGYCGPMGYGRKFSANQLGGQLKLWGKRGYGLIQVWAKRGLTVVTKAHVTRLAPKFGSKPCTATPSVTKSDL